ncbi:copper amine oxidase N-terminal domain-containing protein [Paenibacillus sp. Soil522]|uniref:copper amine oxidase N-terminal domain-containing protein n=1 Tax=Paenibacillus sp. Soil522 TaxID=1736388 RepID=UPI0009D707A8
MHLTTRAYCGRGTRRRSRHPVKIVKGRTMVPLRFVSQAMGAKVVWDGKNREVLLTL